MAPRMSPHPNQSRALCWPRLRGGAGRGGVCHRPSEGQVCLDTLPRFVSEVPGEAVVLLSIRVSGPQSPECQMVQAGSLQLNVNQKTNLVHSTSCLHLSDTLEQAGNPSRVTWKVLGLPWLTTPGAD